MSIAASLALLAATLPPPMVDLREIADLLPVSAGPMSQEDLASRAEVIVYGRIEAIEIEREITDRFDERGFRARFVIDRIETSEALSVGQEVRVDYWYREDLSATGGSTSTGYWPLPHVGDMAWLFARAAPENPEILNPLMPNGWVPDQVRPADEFRRFGGVVVVEIDRRRAPLWPFGIALVVAALPPAAWSLRPTSQSKGPLRLLSLGLLFTGVVMLFW
jgi:hypothetical protein